MTSHLTDLGTPWGELLLVFCLAALLLIGALWVLAVRLLGQPEPPTAQELAEDQAGVDSMRARLQRDSVDPLDDIVDHRGVWWGPRP